MFVRNLRKVFCCAKFSSAALVRAANILAVQLPGLKNTRARLPPTCH